MQLSVAHECEISGVLKAASGFLSPLVDSLILSMPF